MEAYFASLNPMDLLGRFPSGIAQGLIWGIMALGVYITFRLLDIADLSVDGTFSTGAAVTVMLILAGWNPWAALVIAFIAGLIAGSVTGLLHTVFGIPAILAGILTQYGLYSINLVIMKMKANQAVSVDKYNLIISGRNVPNAIRVGGIFAIALIVILYLFFGTELGSAIRATGCNQHMARAQGINTNFNKVLGLMLSNGIVALASALYSQYQGFADINMGRGAIVIGLAAVIIGDVVFGKIFRNFGFKLLGVALGAVMYYLVIQVVLWLGLNTDDLKLLTALVVGVFLSVPYIKGRYFTKTRGKAAK